MKRGTTGTLLSKWKKAFSQNDEAGGAAAGELPAKKDASNQGEAALALIKRGPVTFRISRADSPEDFERALFVCKARSVNAGRPFTAVVHVERTRTGTRLVAGGDLRLHAAEIKARIPKGDYKPAVTKDFITFGEPVEGIVFPNWKNIIPEAAVNKGTLNLGNTGMGRNPKSAAGMSLAFNDFLRKSGEVINLRYLDDLPKKEWNIRVHKDRKTVILLEQKDAEKETYAVFVPLAEAA
jgi:hypothetical protein